VKENTYTYKFDFSQLATIQVWFMKTLLVFIDHPQMAREKRSDISVDGDMIVLQNSIVWPNTKLALEFSNSKEWFCILG